MDHDTAVRGMATNISEDIVAFIFRKFKTDRAGSMFLQNISILIVASNLNLIQSRGHFVQNRQKWL